MNPLRWVLLFSRAACGWQQSITIDMETGEILAHSERSWIDNRSEVAKAFADAAALRRRYTWKKAA